MLIQKSTLLLQYGCVAVFAVAAPKTGIWADDHLFYGPMKQALGEKKLAAELSDMDFGYALKRVGIKEVDAKNWSLTYQRTILGTQENFKIEAALVNDTCRVYLDEKKWAQLFNRQ